MNKMYAKKSEPQPYEQENSKVAKEKVRSFSGLISEINEELGIGYGINYNFKEQIDRLAGSEPSNEKMSDSDEVYVPHYLEQIENILVSLRTLNNRNDNQFYRLKNFIG